MTTENIPLVMYVVVVPICILIIVAVAFGIFRLVLRHIKNKAADDHVYTNIGPPTLPPRFLDDLDNNEAKERDRNDENDLDDCHHDNNQAAGMVNLLQTFHTFFFERIHLCSKCLYYH